MTSSSPEKQTAKKPAAKPEPLTASEKRTYVLNQLIAAGAEIAKNWDPKTGVTKTEAIAILSNRLSYCGTRCDYPAPLLTEV
ncbi:MAG TPA: hypothetical protein VGH77_05190 [Streptosporangiaceae bacterium]|jgi:pectin methylesterase-like acyl-CoA thioesterase